MHINFIPITHVRDETEMGHVLWFRRIPICRAISASANVEGFTPLNAIAREYEWDRNVIKAAADKCNAQGEIAILQNLKPALLLVPQTNGSGNAEFLINDLLAAANRMRIEYLHFTHFGFIQNKLPVQEVTTIIKTLCNPKLATAVKAIYWDVDQRVTEDLEQIYSDVIADLLAERN